MKARKIRFKQVYMLCCLLLLALLLCQIPQPANQEVNAAPSQKAMMSSDTGLSMITNPVVPAADQPWQGDYVHFGQASKWRVLEKSGSQLLLYTDNGLPVADQAFHATSNVYETSAIRTFINNDGLYATFSDSRERAEIVPSTIPAAADTGFRTDGTLAASEADSAVTYTNPAVNQDNLYLLSIREIMNPAYGFYPGGSGNNTSRKTPTDERYWLRSAYRDDAQFPALIDCWPNGGAIHNDYESYAGNMVMAAGRMNTSNIMFVSSAVNGKLSGPYGENALTEIGDANTNEFKFTLYDPNLQVELKQVKRNGNTFSFAYTVHGAANNLSAVLTTESGELLSYGRIQALDAAATGQASVSVPADFDEKKLKLKIFPEDYKGDKKTDFAGDFVVAEPGASLPAYKVVFQDYDGTLLKEEQVEEGSAATAPDDPQRRGYVFVGWDAEYQSIQGDMTLTAQYKAKEYRVQFLDYDGTVLKESMIAHGLAAVPPAQPVRDGFTFTGWDNVYDDIQEDVVIHAVYEKQQEAVERYYKVVFIDMDGTILKEQDVKEGAAALPPTPKAPEGYKFTGWDKEYKNIHGDTVIRAVYEKQQETVQRFHKVVFIDKDGTILKEQDVKEGAEALPPTPKAPEGYKFTGWDKEYKDIHGDIVIRAVYEKNTYKVVFTDTDGTVLKEENVEYGAAASAPEIKEKEGCLFLGWDQDFSFVKKNMQIVAQYQMITGNNDAGKTQTPQQEEIQKDHPVLQEDDAVLTADTQMRDSWLALTVYSMLLLIGLWLKKKMFL